MISEFPSYLYLVLAEKSLIALRKQQREKVEQIKKQTNYYSTRNLIERYDESQPTDSPLRKRPGQASPMPILVTPQRPQGPQPPMQMLQTPQPISPNLQQQLSRTSRNDCYGLIDISFPLDSRPYIQFIYSVTTATCPATTKTMV